MPENSLKNKTDYKRLGDYIREVDSRNRDLAVTKLMGINIGKFFMPSVANVIGTDLSNYKVVFRNCFACNLMHVGRDEKIPIALHDTDEKIIISPAYFVFEISKPEELLPAYLMMWFRRKEFDRNAWFHTDSDVRGGMSRDAFCDLKLPIPPLSRQREIVAEYETLTRRIRLNERLISTLESAAQTLYRRTFVDNIDPARLPPGWRTGTLGDLFELQRGFDLPAQNRKEGMYPILSSTGVAGFHEEYKVHGPGVVTGRSGSIGEVFYVNTDFWPLNTALWVKDFKKSSPFFVYFKLKELELSKLVAGFAAVPTLNRNDVHAITSVIPPESEMEIFQARVSIIHRQKQILIIENGRLQSLCELILRKIL